MCLLRNSVELVVGHVGDSCALLCRSGNPIRLTQDDDPDNAEESRRIQEHGGKIVHNSLGIAQVNGRLSMTRSIGDVELKQYGVTAKPHVRSIEVSRLGRLSDAAVIILCSLHTLCDIRALQSIALKVVAQLKMRKIH